MCRTTQAHQTVSFCAPNDDILASPQLSLLVCVFDSWPSPTLSPPTENVAKQRVIEEELVDAVAQEHYKYIAERGPLMSHRDGSRHHDHHSNMSKVASLFSSVFSSSSGRRESVPDRRRLLLWVAAGRVTLAVLTAAATMWMARGLRGALSEMLTDGLLSSSAEGDGGGDGAGGGSGTQGPAPIPSASR